jgi:transcriptional regulator of acetoin/glycerol metabolism
MKPLLSAAVATRALVPSRTPYVGFEKNPRGVKNLWERFNSGLVDPGERHGAYEDMLLRDWQRCSTLGVDMAMTVARRLSDDEYHQRAQSSRLLVEASVPVIQDVWRFLDVVPGIIVLTDHTGCVMHVEGQPRMREIAADRSGIVEGSTWDESTAGNNGMGSALAAMQPVHVYANEHFCEGWQGWSCTAAPIFDLDGRSVLGIVDQTTMESDRRDEGLALCVSIANSISARMALYRALEHKRLTTAFSEAARHYPNDDILALDPAGRIVAHTPTERCRRIVQTWTSAASVGTPVREIVDVTAPDSGASVGKILLLARPAGYERVFRSLSAPPPLHDAVEAVRQFGAFVTRDPETRRMLNELERVAASDVNVLIIGETGTGKELVARQLHACSPRRSEPYLALNCGAVSPELVESTLFGYVRGAFSGADPRGRAGYFESAQGGTLFLDEVGELPLAMQAALLRVLEDGSYSRVGSCETQRSRCRIVAATHRNLGQLVAEGRFREDLYFRLKIVQKTLKPLRDRRCDIPLLIDQFVGAMREKHRLPPSDFTPEALATMEGYRWPGNAREVRNVVEAAMLCSDGPMCVDSLPPELLRQPEAAPAPPQAGGPEEATRAYERQLIVGMLRKYRKVNAVAKALGIARSTLYLKFAELGIDQRQLTSGIDDA